MEMKTVPLCYAGCKLQVQKGNMQVRGQTMAAGPIQSQQNKGLTRHPSRPLANRHPLSRLRAEAAWLDNAAHPSVEQ